MENSEKIGLNALLERIKGGRVEEIGRAANMLWISIEKDGVMFAVHIQSAFRIIRNGQIFSANGDMYTSATGECYNDFEADMTSDFDLSAKEFNKNSYVIIDTQTDKCNDLKIYLENDILIETFSNNSVEEEEQWRIFQRNNPDLPHYVVYPNKVEEE